MNESQDLYKDYEVGPNSTSVELTGLWKYTNYGIRVLGFTRMGWGVISPEVLVQTDEDGNVEFVLLVCYLFSALVNTFPLNTSGEPCI